MSGGIDHVLLIGIMPRQNNSLTFRLLFRCPAHAMPPFLGQGANQAIQDAHTLAVEVASIGRTNLDLSHALRQYESVRRGPTSALMQSSRIIGFLETQRGPVGNRIRDTLFRVAGKVGAVGQTFVQSATPRIAK